MRDPDDVSAYLLSQIDDGHIRLVALLSERLREADDDSLEKYLAILGKLLGKLDQRDKKLKRIGKEMMAETAALILAELAD